MSDVISILLVDDHAMFRDTLGRRLQDESDIQTMGMCGNAGDAVTETIRLKPNIVLLDIDMPGLICFDAARTIMQRLPETSIIFLSAFAHDRYIEQALNAGAAGYVTKSEPAESVIEAIRKVAGGSVFFSPDIQARIVVGSAGAGLDSGSHSRASMLSNREMEVLRYIARGMAKKDIAQTMHISLHTVNRHTASLMDKLNIHDRVQLARYAIREGLAEA